LGVAGIFGVDIGAMMMAGLVLAVPCVIGITLYARWLGNKYPDFQPEGFDDEPEDLREAHQRYMEEKAGKSLPSLGLSLLPIVTPILLIFINAVNGMIAKVEGMESLPASLWGQAFAFLGSPIIALAISVLLAVYTLMPKVDKHTTLERLEEGLQSAGIILLVTGAGGALGAVLRESGTGTLLAQQVAGLPLAPVLIPFIISTLVRLVQGSGTVAMITAASISAPIISQLPGINMLAAAQAATMGALFFSYFNDSMFWVVNRMMGIKDVRQQMMVWSVPTTIAWAISLVGILILDWVL
jgi:GntP family gluconate:H+ symporter